MARRDGFNSPAAMFGRGRFDAILAMDPAPA
jgi:hypothetical protein